MQKGRENEGRVGLEEEEAKREFLVLNKTIFQQL